MAGWDDGYVTDVPYLSGYFRESAPIWLATAATLLNTAAPDITSKFRYADLGCGNGATALVTAATMPHAEVWAFDFNPAHIASGRDTARRAGLTNIHFEEASFDELASRPREALPVFDYIVTHGVLSWISPENRRRLFDVIGQRLVPGGIAYVSYNVSTGWSGMRPVRTLMRLLVEASPERTDVAAAGVFALLEKMKTAGAAMFQVHPSLDGQLARMRGLDARYVAHELLNRDWHPVMFPAVAPAMAEIKCEYIGSATLQQNMQRFTVPAGLQEMFGRVRDAKLRETLRDIASAAGFRRDLYQRGPRQMGSGEHFAQVDAIGLARTFLAVPEPLTLPSAVGAFSVDQKHYGALLERLAAGPATIGELRRDAALANWVDPGVAEAATLLIDAGYVMPVLPEPPGIAAIQATARLNAVHALQLEQGHDRPFIAYPVLGAALLADELEVLGADTLQSGVAAEERRLTDAVLARLTRGGRQLNRLGEPVTDPAAVREIVSGQMREMLEHRVAARRRLGAVVLPERGVAAVAEL